MNTTTTTPFSYEAFDRYMELFLDMCYVFLNEYDEAHFQEKVTDLRSLCIKAARVCRMTELDFTFQQEDMMHHRRNKNKDYLTALTILHGKVIESMHAAKKEAERVARLTPEQKTAEEEAAQKLLAEFNALRKQNGKAPL